MRALVMHEFKGALPVEEIADPICPSSGVVVGVEACGVCRSDHHAWMGKDANTRLPHVLGHEFAGRVLEVGPEVRSFKVGDRVTAPFLLGCGTCSHCRRAEPTICDSQTVMGFTAWGAFAERMALPHADYNLVKLPEFLDFATAAGMGCRVTTSFRAVVERGNLRPGEWLSVHGCGGIGLSAIMIAAALGAQILAVDVNPEALALAKAMGANVCLNAKDFDSPEALGMAIREHCDGGAHLALDALGITPTMHASLYGLRKLGRQVQIGKPAGAHANPNLPLLDLIYLRQLSMAGTRGMAASGFPALFDMISAGRLDPSRLVSKTIGLSEVGAALSAMDGGEGQSPQVGVTVVTRFDA